MSILQKKKGPASAPTLPSHGPNQSAEEMDMNTYTDSTLNTGAASFPIPYPEQSAADELRNAASLLTVLAESIEAHPHLINMLVVLDVAMRQLKPIELFLDECRSPEFEELFRSCRRRAIVENGSAK